MADKFILKEANSPERLLAETSLFLHRAESSLPEQKREMLDRSLRRDPALIGSKVLIVDDDARNVFALTSALGTPVDGSPARRERREGIDVLDQNPDVTSSLMDIMYQGMDGYETVRAIRRIDRFTNVRSSP